MLWKSVEFWWRVVTGLLAIVGVVLAAVSLYMPERPAQVVLASGLALVATVSMICMVAAIVSSQINGKGVARALRWSLATRNLADAAQQLADLAADSLKLEPATARGQAREACAQLEKAFTAAAGSDCRVTIKELYASENGLAVRSLIAPSRRTLSPTSLDLVADNTDFDAIFSGKDFYIHNNLPQALVSGYQNSHWTPDLLREWEQSGEYPYRSALVLPIRRRSANGSDGSESWDTLGFLCIDSPKQEAFSIEADRHAAELIAAIFVTIWKDLTNEGKVPQ